jgi:exodeoxyribonuclease-5
VLFDESWAFKETRQRWLYTAITRAAKKLTVVR